MWNLKTTEIWDHTYSNQYSTDEQSKSSSRLVGPRENLRKFSSEQMVPSNDPIPSTVIAVLTFGDFMNSNPDVYGQA